MSGDASAEEDAILEELAMISNQKTQNSSAETANELEEERDAFEDMPSPMSLPASGAVHRPIPLMHKGHGQHPRLQALQAAGQQSSSFEESSLASNKQGMSRSISDSTLRRAALHLNLNQSVLPSFTSLQQFKVPFK